MELRRIDGIVIFDIKGAILGDARFDLINVIVAEIKGGCSGIIFNLAEVPQIDSVVLGSIIYAYILLSKDNKKIVLLEPNRGVRYLLVVTKVDQIFEKYETEEGALKSFKK